MSRSHTVTLLDIACFPVNASCSEDCGRGGQGRRSIAKGQEDTNSHVAIKVIMKLFMRGQAIIKNQHYVIALQFGYLGAKGHQVQRWRKGIAMAAPTEDELEDFIKDQRWKVKRCRDLRFSARKGFCLQPFLSETVSRVRGKHESPPAQLSKRWL